LPFRCLILVDEHCADALEEIVTLHDVLRHPVFELKRLLDIEARADLQLMKRYLEACRRRLGDARQRRPRPLGLFTLQRGDDALDRIRGKSAVDRRAQLDERRRFRGHGKTGEHAVDLRAFFAFAP